MGGGAGAAVHDSLPVDPLDPVDPVPCRKVVFRLYETLTFENRVLKVIVTLRRL